jgi:predicted dehydrogenase
MISVGIIGYGYWGPNLARNVQENSALELKTICDTNAAALAKARERYPTIKCVEDAGDIFSDETIDAVMIATPVSTHYDLASQSIKSGKHVLVEKPMTNDVQKAAELIGMAKEKGRILMVDHTFIYSPAVQTLKEVISSGTLGDILYYDSVRVNLGLFQHDINVIWDLAPHDISIMYYLVGKVPRWVSAYGASHVGNGLENIAYVNLGFDDEFLAHFHVNWLAPVKIRQVLIGGSRKMVVYNDVEPTEKIKIYDTGIDVTTQEGIYKTLIQYRTGDISVPHIENRETLSVEMDHFVNCVQNGTTPWTDGQAGLEVVKVLQATQESIRQNGIPIELS